MFDTSSAILKPESIPSGHIQKSGCNQVPEGSPPNAAFLSIISSATFTSPTLVLKTSPFTDSSIHKPASTVVTMSPSNSLDINASKESNGEISPFSSIVIILSASPSWAIPKSAPIATTVFIKFCKFSAFGSGFLPGKNPSTWELRVVTSQPAFLNTNGDISLPAPDAQSITTFRPGLILTILTKSSMYWALISSLTFKDPTLSQGTEIYFLFA